MQAGMINRVSAKQASDAFKTNAELYAVIDMLALQAAV
jgi:hypothetical protein